MREAHFGRRDNIDFYIDAKWDKKTAVTVKLELQKVSDKTVVQTENWNFSAKPYYPTTPRSSRNGRPFDARARRLPRDRRVPDRRVRAPRDPGAGDPGT